MDKEEQKTILLVEDDKVTAKIALRKLSQEGYKIFHTWTGEEAIEFVQNSENPIDLILMDIDLGLGMDGTQAAQEILKNHAIPLLFLSSHTEKEIVQKTEKITSYGYVVKNSSFTVLDASIKMAFKLFETRKKLQETMALQTAMVTHMGDGITILDREGVAKYHSPNLERLFGWKPEELFEYKDPWFSVHPEDLNRVQETFQSVSKHPHSMKNLEFRYLSKQNQYRWLELTAVNCLEVPDLEGILLNYHDITEQKINSENIQLSERRYRSLFSEMQEGFALHEIICNDEGKPVDYRFLDLNPSFEELTGLKKELVVGKSVREILPNTESIWIEKYGEVALTGKSISFEYVSQELHKYYKVVAFCPQPGQFAVVFNDITDQKNDEEKLRKSEKQFRNLVEDMQIGVLLQGVKSEIILCNNKALELLGLSEDQLLGKTSLDPDWNVIHEDGSPFPGSEHPVPRAIASGIPQRNVTMGVYHALKKSRVWLSVDAVPQLNEDGSVHQVVCTFKDISDRKMVEAELQKTSNYLENLVNYANAPIIVWDSEYRITEFNRAFERLSGRSAASVIGQTVDLLFPQSTQESSMEFIKRATGGDRWEVVEIEIQSTTGNIYTLLWNSATIYSSDGKKPIATIAQGQDITLRKLTEEKVQALLKEKSLILTEVHHRIKNNMNTIYSLLTLQAGEQTETTLKNILFDAAGRVQCMMLLYEKLYRSENVNSISLKEYIPTLMEEIIRIFPRGKELKILTDIEDIQLSAHLLSPLGIIINEFVTNSMKYAFNTQENGQIRVKVHRENSQIFLSFEDNGVGFPEKDEQQQAQGFGLQLVGWLVAQIHGTLNLEKSSGTKYLIKFQE